MATKLKNLHLTKVDAVDEGANPGARITLFKRRQPPEAPKMAAGGSDKVIMEPEGQEDLLKRFCGFLVESGSIDAAVIEKQAKSFKSTMDALRRDQINAELYALSDALCESVRSILWDEELDEAGRQAALAQSLLEFSETFTGCTASWSAGTPCGIRKKCKDKDTCRKTPDAGSGKVQPGTEDGEEDDAGQEETDNTENKEGDEEDMNIDKSKMTPEDLKAYEALVTKYAVGGDGDEGVNGTGASTQGAGAPAGTADPGIAKGSSVQADASAAIQAELESLRKFRQEMELSQMAAFAKKYEPLGKKPEELAKTLKAAKDAGGTAYADMVSMLDEMLSMQEGLFTEIGKSGHKPVQAGGTEAVSKVNEIAKGYLDKDPGLSMDMALAKAWENHPELMQAYESEAGF